MNAKILFRSHIKVLKLGSDMKNVIEIKNLKKYYRYGVRSIAIKALDGISLSVSEGEVFGLIGPNGAGKSTTIKILLGLIRQNAGECLLFDKPVCKETKKMIGYLPENPYFYKYLTGLELVSFYAKLCGLNAKESKVSAENALEIVGLADAMNRPISLYSKGMVQRAGIAQAIVHNPKLVVLDEPASGLDPVGAADMVNIILRLKNEGKTVLLCSHIMSEVEKLCSRVAILCGGKIAAIGELDKLLEINGRTNFELDNADDITIAKIAEYAESLGVKVAKKSTAKVSLEEFFKKTVDAEK